MSGTNQMTALGQTHFPVMVIKAQVGWLDMS